MKKNVCWTCGVFAWAFALLGVLCIACGVFVSSGSRHWAGIPFALPLAICVVFGVNAFRDYRTNHGRAA